jgi:hypothetical protein
MKTDDAFLFQAGEGAVEGPGRAEELAALVNSRW